jgi:hypothetical protein
LLADFQRERATYQAFRPLGTREEVQQLRRDLELALKGQLAPYGGPGHTQVPVTPDEEQEESKRRWEQLQRQMAGGTLDDAVDTDDDEGVLYLLVLQCL